MLIAGGTSGIGRALAVNRVAAGDQVQVVGMSDTKGRALEDDLRGAAGSIEFYRADLSSVEETKRCAAEYLERNHSLDALFLNAGIIPRRAEVDDAGLDKAFVVNYLHRFILMILFNPILHATAGSRIALTGDEAVAPRFKLDDQVFGRRYTRMEGVSQSFMANSLLAYWTNRVFDSGVPICVVSPGHVTTQMSTKQVGVFMRVLFRLHAKPVTPETATAAIVEGLNGIPAADTDGRFLR